MHAHTHTHLVSVHILVSPPGTPGQVYSSPLPWVPGSGLGAPWIEVGAPGSVLGGPGSGVEGPGSGLGGPGTVVGVPEFVQPSLLTAEGGGSEGVAGVPVGGCSPPK